MNEPRDRKVLIVDDSPTMRRFVKRVLDVCDFPNGKVLEAGDGAEALDILRSGETIDIVLTDINMPNVNGEQLLAQMSLDPALAMIPVIVISTDATHVRTSRMMKLGARGYVSKPFAPESLSAALRQAVDALPEASL